MNIQEALASVRISPVNPFFNLKRVHFLFTVSYILMLGCQFVSFVFCFTVLTKAERVEG